MGDRARASGGFSAPRFLLRIAGLVVGALFVYASLDKIVHPDRFADIVHDYELLPLVLVNAFALTMPWLEVVVGVALILGMWRRAAGLVATALTSAFLAAIASAELRGLEVECGCFEVSGLSATQASWGLFSRDIALLGACALIWRRG